MVFSHTKNGVSLLLRVGHEPQRLGQDLLVDRLHALLGERPGVIDLLGAVVLRPRVQHTSRAEPLPELRELLFVRVVRELRLLLGVEVVEVAEELVEPMGGGQELVPVAEVVLPELAGDVAALLQRGGDRRVLGAEPDVRARHADLGQTGAHRVLAGDERSPTGGAALFAVVVGEPDALRGDAVDVGGAVPISPSL